MSSSKHSAAILTESALPLKKLMAIRKIQTPQTERFLSAAFRVDGIIEDLFCKYRIILFDAFGEYFLDVDQAA